MSVEPQSIDARAAMPASEVRRRVSAGAVVLAARGSAVRLIAFGGNIVLARLLVPEDFGLVALGLAAYQFGAMLTSAGIGAALVRRREPPTREELRSILGFQLGITVLLAMGTLVLALIMGQGAVVVAIIVASLPLTAFRAPGALLLQRDLAYKPVATAEILEVLAYYGWAVTSVALGFSVWGFASASIAQAVVGSVFMVAVSPMRVLLPGFRWSPIKPLFGFGLKFQAVQVVRLVKDQGVNIGIAAIAGIATLGLWTLAYRIMRVPYLLFESLWRVSYPGMSRLLDAGETPAPVLERSVRLVALAAGGMYAPLIASGPALVPSVFGGEWQPVVAIVPMAGLGLMIAAPISVAASGYLYAIGDAGIILKITIIQSAVWLVLGLSLLLPIGVAALGIAWLVSSLVSAAIFSQAIKSRLGVGLISPTALPLAIAAVAAAGGWIVASSSPPSITLALGTVLLSEFLFMLGIAATQRPAMRDFVRIGMRGMRSAAAFDR